MEVVLAVPVVLAVDVGEAEALLVELEVLLEVLVGVSVPVAPPHKKARSNNSIIRISSAMGSGHSLLK